MSILTAAPVPIQQFFDNNGLPLSNGTLGTFAAGTSTPQTVWTDSLGTIAYAQPIPLNASGRPAGPIYPPITPAIKYILKDQNGVVIWTGDNLIASAPSS
jgi:hypothetical protein